MMRGHHTTADLPSALNVFAVAYLVLIAISSATLMDVMVEQWRHRGERVDALASALRERADGRPATLPKLPAGSRLDVPLLITTFVVAALIDVVCRAIRDGSVTDLDHHLTDSAQRALFAAFVAVMLRLLLVRRGPQTWRASGTLVGPWLAWAIAAVLVVVGFAVGAD